MTVCKTSLHPPALGSDGDRGEEIQIPWVLLEYTAYVADRRNATTAYYTDTTSGAQIQVTFCFARPPRVSYVCVYHHHGHAHASSSSKAKVEEEVIISDPRVLSTDANLVLLSIVLGPLPDLYIYRAAGDGVPSLTRIERPPCGRFDINQVGVLSWHTIRRNDDDDDSGVLSSFHRARQDDTPYMVAALHYADLGQQPGHKLYVYDSRQQPGSWRTHTVSVDERHSQKHGEQDGNILHQNCKVIAIGGKHGTMGFVDLWRGIMLCDLLLIKDDNPTRLGYTKLPPPLLPDEFTDDEDQGDAHLYRDIAVVEDRIMYVEHDFHLVELEPCPTCCYRDQNQCLEDGWVAATWSRRITSALDDDHPWEKHHEIMDSSDVDITTPQFDLLPTVHDYQHGRPFPPFKRLTIIQPTIGLSPVVDATVYFIVKKDINDGKAWVIAVDMPNNKLEAVFEFDAHRSACMGFVYMQSGISKYLKSNRASPSSKGSLKRRGEAVLLLPLGSSSSNKKHHPGSGILIKPMPLGATEEKPQDLEMEDMAADDGDYDNMLLDL